MTLPYRGCVEVLGTTPRLSFDFRILRIGPYWLKNEHKICLLTKRPTFFLVEIRESPSGSPTDERLRTVPLVLERHSLFHDFFQFLSYSVDLLLRHCICGPPSDALSLWAPNAFSHRVPFEHLPFPAIAFFLPRQTFLCTSRVKVL